MIKLRNGGIALAAAVFLTQTAYSAPAKPLSPLTIPYINQEVIIDGEVTDDAWQQASELELTLVNSPWNNQPSPVKTTVKYFQNGDKLFIAFIADDPDPSKIKGFLSDRDTTLGDDLVGIKLDPYNDHRLDYQFLVNPYGVQNDAIENENTGEVNRLWDGIWDSFGKKTATGYQVEMAIPFNVLNFEQTDSDKVWSIEFLRLYPRDERLRISHIPLDRNNNCWVCQMAEIKGFKEAKIGKKFRLTPYAALNMQQTRDPFDSQDKWHTENDVDKGLDVHWGITPSTSLSATINPDFSTVESDAGQLSVNKNFSLFYDEKRPFFLENTDYFSSSYNLVYTRNIADPDYGVKLTSRESDHSYGFFATNDTQTNIILPGNLGSSITTINKESQVAALNLRQNITNDFSVGLISTYRGADDYHNWVTGVDSKYRFDQSNSITAQVLIANTHDQITSTDQYNGSDNAYKVLFEHESEDWQITLQQQQINRGFRADLGFMTKNDFKQSYASVKRLFYGDNNAWWSKANLYSTWNIQHSQQNELIEQDVQIGASIYGPMLSFITGSYERTNTVGLRHDPTSDAIDGNTTRFVEQIYAIYGEFQPTARIFIGGGVDTGEKIDYRNNRLGDFNEWYTYLTFNFTDHLTVDVTARKTALSADNPTQQFKQQKVYDADLVDMRISYQFNVKSYLKLNLVYQNVKRNPNNNPLMSYVSPVDKSLSTQLIYAYQLNPQTVFYLGYSDSSFQYDNLDSLTRDSRTFFTKVSYAWMP